MNIRSKTLSRLKELEKELESIKEMQTKIAEDHGLRSYIGIEQRDKIMSYYTRREFAVKDKINLLQSVL